MTGLTSAHGAENVCARFGAATVSGHVKSTKLTEISGVVASRQYPGVYWTHNDSGGKPEVFALALDGTDLGSYTFPGATATDWEGIAIGPKSGATGSYIYAADIGDNAAEAPLNGLGTAREKVTIFRAAEPARRAEGARRTAQLASNASTSSIRPDAKTPRRYSSTPSAAIWSS